MIIKYNGNEYEATEENFEGSQGIPVAVMGTPRIHEIEGAFDASKIEPEIVGMVATNRAPGILVTIARAKFTYTRTVSIESFKIYGGLEGYCLRTGCADAEVQWNVPTEVSTEKTPQERITELESMDLAGTPEHADVLAQIPKPTLEDRIAALEAKG